MPWITRHIEFWILLLEAMMRSFLGELSHILIEHALVTILVKDAQVVEAFLSHTSQESFADRIFAFRMHRLFYIFFFFNDPPPPEIYPLSLHAALPIYFLGEVDGAVAGGFGADQRAAEGQALAREHAGGAVGQLLVHAGHEAHFAAAHADVACRHVRSEEHTSELQSPCNLVCRLLLENI